MGQQFKSACTRAGVRTSRRHARSSVRSVGRDGSQMRCPLVTIRYAYGYRQGRSNHGRAGEEYMVWMCARGVLVCPRAGRMRRLRVRFVPDGTSFQEEPIYRDRRGASFWRWASQLQTDATRHARTFLRARRARADERRQWVCTLRDSACRRRVQADPQRPDRVLASQP